LLGVGGCCRVGPPWLVVNWWCFVWDLEVAAGLGLGPGLVKVVGFWRVEVAAGLGHPWLVS
jgi:hypothetical protein